MIREELLALADELEGMDCRTCPADGTKDCRDLPCEEAVARAASRRIREIAEHDACEEAATTVSAYDLLPDEDRKAIEWVREHGGLGAVEKRLMPDGMEWLLDVWPRWSNGEYCKFGDWWKAGKYGEPKPRQLSRLAFFTPEQLREWGQDEGENFGYAWDFMRPSDTTYRPDKVEPPAPKALAADGKPLEVGQTVYAPHYDYVRCTVLSFEWAVDGWLVEVENEGGNKFRQTPDCFTHQRPVLDADGEPIREGDTLYVLGFGEPLTVKGFTDDGRVLMSFHDENSLGYKTSKLTHEQPDTWERLEHDAEKTVCEYFGANYDCANCPLEPDRCDEEAKKDIIRRAKKLAERGER